MMIGMVMSRPVLASNIGGDVAGSVLTVVSSFNPATAAGAASRAKPTLITMRVAVVNQNRCERKPLIDALTSIVFGPDRFLPSSDRSYRYLTVAGRSLS